MFDLETILSEYLFDGNIGKIVAIILGSIIIWSIFKVIKSRLEAKIKDNENRYRVKKSLDFATFFFVLILVMVVFSDKLGNFTVALGVAGAGIAFALQEVIVSIAGWLAIMFAGFYKVGDRVQLGGIKGDVIDIGVLRTTIMEIGQWVDGDLYNGRIVRVANSFIFKDAVFNYSGDFPFLWDEIKIPVMFGGDYDLAQQIFSKAADEILGSYADHAKDHWRNMVRKYRIENAQIEPMITLAATDNWVEYTIRYVTDFKQRRATKNKLFAKILTEIEKTNGKVKFASSTFQLVENVNVKQVL